MLTDLPALIEKVKMPTRWTVRWARTIAARSFAPVRIPTRVIVCPVHRLLQIFVTATLVSVAGVYFAYHTESSSSMAWIKWGNGQAWVGDSARAVLLAVFAALLVRVSFSMGRGRVRRYLFVMNARTMGVAAIFLAAVVWLNFFFYPKYFELELLRNTHGYLDPADLQAVRSDRFAQVYKPFFTYFLYAMPLWMCVILPTFLLFLLGFTRDLRRIGRLVQWLRDSGRVAFHGPLGDLAEQMAGLNAELSTLRRNSQSCIDSLRYLVQRYLPALLVVVIGFLFGNIALGTATVPGNQVVVAVQTDEARNSFSWIVLIFLVVFGVLLWCFFRLFGAYADVVAERVDRLRSIVAARSLHHSLADRIDDESQKWDLRRMEVVRLLGGTLVNTGALHVPLLLALTIALFSYAISDHSRALIPTEIHSWVQRHFLRPAPAIATPSAMQPSASAPAAQRPGGSSP